MCRNASKCVEMCLWMLGFGSISWQGMMWWMVVKMLPYVFGACREKGMVPKDAPYIPLLGAKWGFDQPFTVASATRYPYTKQYIEEQYEAGKMQLCCLDALETPWNNMFHHMQGLCLATVKVHKKDTSQVAKWCDRISRTETWWIVSSCRPLFDGDGRDVHDVHDVHDGHDGHDGEGLCWSKDVGRCQKGPKLCRQNFSWALPALPWIFTSLPVLAGLVGIVMGFLWSTRSIRSWTSRQGKGDTGKKIQIFKNWKWGNMKVVVKTGNVANHCRAWNTLRMFKGDELMNTWEAVSALNGISVRVTTMWWRLASTSTTRNAEELFHPEPWAFVAPWHLWHVSTLCLFAALCEFVHGVLYESLWYFMSCISCSCSRSKDLPQNGGESLNESGQHLRAGLAERWHSHSPVECGRQKRKHLVFCGILYFVFQTSKLATKQSGPVAQGGGLILTTTTRPWTEALWRGALHVNANIRQLSLHFFLSKFQSSRHWSLYFFGNFQSCFLHFSRDAVSCWWVFKQLFEKGLVYRTSSYIYIYISRIV